MLLIMLFGLGWFIDLPNGVVVEGIDVLTAGRAFWVQWLVLGLSGSWCSLLLESHS